MITRTYSATELTLPKAAMLVRVATNLTEDYLLPPREIALVDISNGVEILVE